MLFLDVVSYLFRFAWLASPSSLFTSSPSLRFHLGENLSTFEIIYPQAKSVSREPSKMRWWRRRSWRSLRSFNFSMLGEFLQMENCCCWALARRKEKAGSCYELSFGVPWLRVESSAAAELLLRCQPDGRRTQEFLGERKKTIKYLMSLCQRFFQQPPTQFWRVELLWVKGRKVSPITIPLVSRSVMLHEMMRDALLSTFFLPNSDDDFHILTLSPFRSAYFLCVVGFSN